MRTRALRRRTNREHDGKKPYDDEHDAKAAAALANLRYMDNQQPYVCSSCGKWHVGHPPRAQAR